MIDLTDVIDPLGDNFESESAIEGCPKHIWKESAAIKHLRTGKGVVINLPSERGQLLKGVQPGFITEVTDDDDKATTAAMAIAEINEVEQSYEEAQLRVDWPKWRKAINVELQNLKKAKT